MQAGDKEGEASGHIWSEGDMFITGTKAGLMGESVGAPTFHPTQHYTTWTVAPPTEDLKQLLQHCTGWQSVPLPPDHPLPS